KSRASRWANPCFLSALIRSFFNLHCSVTDAKTPPTFTRKLTSMQGIVDVIELTCHVTGTSPMKVTWSKDNKDIRTGGNYRIGLADDTPKLIILKASYGDTGSYTCTVSNEAGTASSVWFFLIACFNIYIYIFNLLLATIKTEDLFPLF
uniref:Ig-like domain-containing protein n=1 Tax=Erpetoichthys calabaricus TaxID=27687 RepID=A0A8C4S444_ERPCA